MWKQREHATEYVCKSELGLADDSNRYKKCPFKDVDRRRIDFKNIWKKCRCKKIFLFYGFQPAILWIYELNSLNQLTREREFSCEAKFWLRFETSDLINWTVSNKVISFSLNKWFIEVLIEMGN